MDNNEYDAQDKMVMIACALIFLAMIAMVACGWIEL